MSCFSNFVRLLDCILIKGYFHSVWCIKKTFYVTLVECFQLACLEKMRMMGFSNCREVRYHTTLFISSQPSVVKFIATQNFVDVGSKPHKYYDSWFLVAFIIHQIHPFYFADTFCWAIFGNLLFDSGMFRC